MMHIFFNYADYFSMVSNNGLLIDKVMMFLLLLAIWKSLLYSVEDLPMHGSPKANIWFI